jgi:alpha-1,6-mannosyltransferase
VNRLARLFSRRGALVVLSAPAYACLFSIFLRNSLPALMAGGVPPDLGYSAGASPVLQGLQMACLAYLFTIYAFAIWQWRRLDLSLRTVAWSAAAVALMACSLLPADSSDVLEYIGFGRLAAIYHVSPYTHTEFEIHDPFDSYITWDEPMPYGPIVLPVFAAAAAASSRHLLMAIYEIKGVWLVVHLLNASLIYGLARSFAVDPVFALFVFAFNPLLLLEQPGNGHNDGLLILCWLLALGALARGQHGRSLWLAFLSALVKATGLFWFAGIAALLVRQRRWRALGRGTAAAAATLAALFAVAPGRWAMFTVVNTWEYAEDSLHTLAIEGVRPLFELRHIAWHYDELFRIDRAVFSVLLVGLVIWRFSGVRDRFGLVREIGVVLLALLLGYAASVHPWYAAWLVPIAALTDSGALRRTILVFSGAALLLYAFPVVLVEQAPGHAWWSAIRIGLAFGVPLVFWRLQGVREPSGVCPVPVNVTSGGALESKVVSGGWRPWNRWEND